MPGGVVGAGMPAGKPKKAKPAPRRPKPANGPQAPIPCAADSKCPKLRISDPTIAGHVAGAAHLNLHRDAPTCVTTSTGVTVTLIPTVQVATQVSMLEAGVPGVGPAGPSTSWPSNLPQVSSSRTWVIPSGQEDEFAAYFSDGWISQGCPALANDQQNPDPFLNKLGFYYAFNANTGPIASFNGVEWPNGVLPYAPLAAASTSYGKSLTVVTSKRVKWTFSCSNDIVGTLYVDSMKDSVALSAGNLARDYHAHPVHEDRSAICFQQGAGYQSSVGTGPTTNPSSPDVATNGLYKAYVDKIVKKPIMLRPGITVVEMDCSFPGTPPLVDSWYMLLDRTLGNNGTNGPARNTQDWASNLFGALFAVLTAGRASVLMEVRTSYSTQPLKSSLFSELSARPERIDIPPQYFGCYGVGYSEVDPETAAAQARREMYKHAHRNARIEGDHQIHAVAMMATMPGGSLAYNQEQPRVGSWDKIHETFGPMKSAFQSAGSFITETMAPAALSLVKQAMDRYGSTEGVLNLLKSAAPMIATNAPRLLLAA